MKSLLMIVVMASLSAACNKSERTNTEAATDTQTSPAGGEGKGALSGIAEVQKALGSYETIRAALAKDDTKDVAAAANQLAKSARAAASKVKAPSSEQLNAVATASEQLASKASGDIGEVRKAFGELSRPVVALVSAHPELQEGRHVFECPMAEGYKKWVQTKDTIDNPYMGKSMLECGAKTDWGAT